MSRRVHAVAITLVTGALAGCGGGQPAPDAATSEPASATADARSTVAPWFAPARDTGIDFRHESGADGRFLFPEIMGGGVALLDIDGDADLDVYFVQGGSVAGGASAPGNRLYRNEGGLRFADVTEGSGADDRGYGMGVATGDYDGDGDVDVYVTNVGPNALLRNDGDGHFTDVTTRAGVGHGGWGTSAAFLDGDADGDLDLFVVNYVVWSEAADIPCYGDGGRRDYCAPQSYRSPQRDAYYENRGDGTFADRTAEARLSTAFGNGLGVVCLDFDRDGLADVFVANDGTPNQLWRNRGDGTFEDVAMQSGCAVDANGDAKAGMGTDAVDIDDDGDEDLLVVNLRAQSDSMYRNVAGSFVDDTLTYGLGAASRPYTRFGTAWVDFDADGALDIFQANGRVALPGIGDAESRDPYAEEDHLFVGAPDARVTPHPLRGGTAEPLRATSRGAAFGDLDGDGDPDLVVVNRDAAPWILENVAPRRGHWLRLDVRDAAGAPALGAVVTIGVTGPNGVARTITRRVRTAYSYCAASDPVVHVGLGAADAVSTIVVQWADQAVQAFPPVGIDATATLRRGGGANGP